MRINDISDEYLDEMYEKNAQLNLKYKKKSKPKESFAFADLLSEKEKEILNIRGK